MPSTSLTVDRYLVAAAVVLTCVLFTAQAADPVNVVKLAALTTLALGVAVNATYRLARHRTASVPWSPAALVAGALLLTLVVATVAAPVTSTAVFGAYGRNSGLLAYVSALVLFLAVLRSVDRTTASVVVGGLVLAGLFTATYGLLQRAGIDAVPWNNPFNPVIAALGNPNFASGYMGITGSVAVGAACWAGWSRGWRLASGVTGALCLVAASLSASVQGPIALAAGLGVVALGLILDARSRVRVAGLAALGAVAVLGTTALVLGALRIGPATAIFTDNGSRARVHYWEAALAMFGERPLVGVGLDQYGNFWRSARSVDSVDLLGGPSFSDAAHSVPLQFLAQGGLVMGAAYAAFVGLTGYALVRGLLRLRGQERALLACVGGGWAAYQVQSLVSIDQVPLIVLHFVLAGAVMAVAGQARLREVRLPGAPEPVKASPNDARTRRRVGAVRPATRSVSAVDGTVIAVVAVGALVAAWLAAAPFRASLAVQDGDARLTAGDGNQALTAYEQATDVAPGVSVYWNRIGNLFDQVDQPARARQAYERAVDRDPYDINAVLLAAARAEDAGDLDASRALFERAVEIDPLNVDTLVPAATFELRHSGAERARELLEGPARTIGDDARLWATLGDARAVLGDAAGAREAYQRALELDPGSEVARLGLQKLAA